MKDLFNFISRALLAIFISWSFFAHSSEEVTCSQELQFTHLQQKIESLKLKKTDSSSQHALQVISQALQSNPEHLKIFNTELRVKAETLFLSKMSKLLNEVENASSSPNEINKSIFKIYGEIMSELKVKVLHLEDTASISLLWSKWFMKNNVNIAQTDQGEALKFWLDCANPEETFIFLDARIYGEVIGVEIAKMALHKGFKKVYMASDEINLELPPGVTNVLKMPGDALKMIQKESAP